MKQLFIFLSVILLVSSYSLPDKLFWHERKNLTWDDFAKIKTKKPSIEKAQIHTFLILGGGFYIDTIFQISVYSGMYINESFVEDGFQNNRLLFHEQGHYDLNEYAARLMRKEFYTYDFDSINMKKDIKTILKNFHC